MSRATANHSKVSLLLKPFLHYCVKFPYEFLSWAIPSSPSGAAAPGQVRLPQTPGTPGQATAVVVVEAHKDHR